MLCRTFSVELKPIKGWKGRKKHPLGRLLAGYWRPRKNNEWDKATTKRLLESSGYLKGTGQSFQAASVASAKRAWSLFRLLDDFRAMPIAKCQEVLGPQFWRCRSCGKAFFAETRRGYRAYCDGGKCGSAATARKRVEKVRAGKHAELLRLATKELGRMAGGPNAKERLAAKIAVTPKWITRQINSGELMVPAPLRSYLYPTRAKTDDVRKTRPGRSSFTPHPLPTPVIGKGPGWKIAHENYGSLEGDRNAIERFNEFLAELARQ